MDTDTELNGFAAQDSGVSPDTTVEDGGSAQTQDAAPETAPETPAEGARGGTPAESKVVPQTDLDNLRSVYDRKLSEQQKQLQTYQQSLQNMEMALLQARWEGMAPEEAQAEKAEYAAIVQQRAVQAAKEQMAQKEAQLNELAKPIYAQELSKRFGVPVETLLKFPDASSMQLAAESLSVHTNAVKTAERKATGVDRMEGTGSAGGGPAWGDKRGEDLLTWFYANRKRG